MGLDRKCHRNNGFKQDPACVSIYFEDSTSHDPGLALDGFYESSTGCCWMDSQRIGFHVS